MTSLLGRLVSLFPGGVPLEDLFTEAVARLFETRPALCLAWLREAGLVVPRDAENDTARLNVESQRKFAALSHHDKDSRPDLVIEARWPSEARTEVVIVESKIWSKEGDGQLRRYAEHLDALEGFGGKTLAYVTRGYDPKDRREILGGLNEAIRFKPLRWHDFYRFLQTVEKDALIEEVMAFMEEQGMASTYRFSAGDLVALSGVPRAIEIFDEALGSEVRAELESFAGSRVKDERTSLRYLREDNYYSIVATLTPDGNVYCYAGYALGSPDGYPWVHVSLEADPRAADMEWWLAFMGRFALRDGWEDGTADEDGWAGVGRERSLVEFLQAEDHVADVRSFFIEAIRELEEALANSEGGRPDSPRGER